MTSNSIETTPAQKIAIAFSKLQVPNIMLNQGEQATRCYLEFFTAKIRNKGTRQVYSLAASRFFDWCNKYGFEIDQIRPIVVATYIESLAIGLSAPTVKLHLAAIRMLFDHLVVNQIVSLNPAASVRGPKYKVTKGKTPVLDAEDARRLLDVIDISTIAGLRDRALIGVMVFSFARISAAIGMNVDDYFSTGRRMWFRLHEKNGKYHEVPAHHKAEHYLHEYLLVSGIDGDKGKPLFRTIGRNQRLSGNCMSRSDALRMVKRYAEKAGLPDSICCHTFRATGITAYLSNGGTLENAMRIAAHESARTTKLYDRTRDELTLEEIERVRI